MPAVTTSTIRGAGSAASKSSITVREEAMEVTRKADDVANVVGPKVDMRSLRSAS